MLAGLTEHLYEQLGGGVDDQRLIAKAIRRKYESNHLRNLLHVLQAGHLMNLGENVQRTEGGGLLSLLDSDLIGYPACHPRSVWSQRDLTGDVDQRPSATERDGSSGHVRGKWRRGWGEFMTKLAETIERT